MKNLIQYHRPERMGCGVDEIGGPPFSILTSVANGNPIGDRVWLVGRTSDLSSDVCSSATVLSWTTLRHPITQSSSIATLA